MAKQKIKGFMRRKKYSCTRCWSDMMEYPGDVMNSAELVCDKCQAERDGESTVNMKPVKLTKISAGNYEYVYPDGTVAKVYKHDVSEYGRYERWTIKTMNASRSDIISYSDPIKSKRDCVAAIQDELDNPEKYGRKWVATATPSPDNYDASWRCPHCNAGYLNIKPVLKPFHDWKTCSTCHKEYMLNYTPAPVQEIA